MNRKGIRNRTERVVNIYEGAVWLFYACLFKYSHYLDKREYYLQRIVVPKEEQSNFPLPQLIIYAVVMTLYIIPFYRLIVPALLNRKKYLWLFATVLGYFEIVPKITNWLVSGLFLSINASGRLHFFYNSEFNWYTFTMRHLGGMDLRVMLTDIIAFLSIAFMRFALDNEQKKHLLEKDNLVLQLESLKAQLHPHFLFNTLNSIYGMSLSGSPGTPGFILKLSDMMRFILYDCQHNTVPLEKDIEFLENYIAMEKQRYPTANIDFCVTGDAGEEIAPLLFIPFAENSFKHGSHRVLDNGQVTGRLTVEKDKLHFVLENDVMTSTRQEPRYGGVGIENVRRRLELYYPGRHSLSIQNDQRQFRVELLIQLKP